MDDLTRYLELADRLTAKFRDMNGEQQWDLRVEDIEAAQSAIRALVERVRELENVAKPFDFAHAGFAEVLWGHLPDDTPGTIIVPLGAQRRLHNALAQGKPGEAHELPTPSGHAES